MRASALAVLAVLLFSVAPFANAHPDPGPEWPGEPYMETWIFNGRIGCAVGHAPLATSDLCATVGERIPGASPDPIYDNTFSFPADAGWSALSVTILSKGGLIEATAMELTWEVPVGAIPALTGELPLHAEYHFTPDIRFTQIADTARFSVRIDPTSGSPQIAVEQGYTVCMGVFYNGLEIPAGFDPCA